MKKSEGQSPGTVKSKDTEVQARLESLKKEYSSLHEKRIATEQDKRNLEDQLSNLRDKAKREYGTDDLEELREMLKQWRKENEDKVNAYESHIQDIKAKLEAIEKREAVEE